MTGFVIGTVCLFGLFGLMRAARHRACGGGYGYGYGFGPGRWHHGHRHGRHGGGGRAAWADGGVARAAGEVLKRRLRIDEDQEGIVDHAMTDLREAGKEYVAVLRDARKDLAAAFSGEAVDEAAIASVFARHDEELAKARRDAVSALKQIHSVLEPEQRKAATDWLGSVEPGWV